MKFDFGKYAGWIIAVISIIGSIWWNGYKSAQHETETALHEQRIQQLEEQNKYLMQRDVQQQVTNEKLETIISMLASPDSD